MALGTRTKFQFEILTINVISSIVYFREIILESSRNVSETTPWGFKPSRGIGITIMIQYMQLTTRDWVHSLFQYI